MRKESLQFLRKLIETPSPSGFEQPAQKLIRQYMKKYADEVRTDVHGNLMGILNPKAPFRVMLAGHCDEIGLMVNHVDDHGYIFFQPIGGVDLSLMPGQRVTIHNSSRHVPGVIGKMPIHLMDAKEREKGVTKAEKLWIDIGAKDRKDAFKLIDIGDPITISVGFQELANGMVAGRGFDDRAGSFVVAEALRLLHGRKLSIGVYAVTTVQEELGMRGARTSAFGIEPQAGIAVDVGFASDFPEADKKLIGEVSLGKGPILHRGANINPVLGRLIEKTAQKEKIPVQIQAAPRATGTDANVIQINRAGAAAALVSVPNRYMHTPVEVVSLDDIENAAKLVAASVAAIRPSMDFTP